MAGDLWDAPNQQVVRDAPPAVEEAPGFDPGAYTVEEVKQYVTDHPDEADAIRTAEEAGKARASLLDWL